MTKVRIRRVVSRTRWQLITFTGKNGGESVGIVDLLAIRKNHRDPPPGMKRGDAFEIILVQVKGGGAARPTDNDVVRLRAVAERYRAEHSFLALWKKGRQVEFCELKRTASGGYDWEPVSDLELMFR